MSFLVRFFDEKNEHKVNIKICNPEQVPVVTRSSVPEALEGSVVEVWSLSLSKHCFVFVSRQPRRVHEYNITNTKNL